MKERLQRLHALSRITFLDGVRKHALLGLVVLSIAAIASGFLFMDFFGRDVGRASSDYLFSVMWIAGLMMLFFHAVQAIAWDEERKVIYTLLSRPLSRGEYVIGTWAGIAALLILLHTLLGSTSWLVLSVIKASLDPVYFPELSAHGFILAWIGLLVSQLVILAVIVLFSSIMRGAFPVLLMSLAYYGICSGLPVIRESITQGDNILPSTGLMLKLMSFVFPDLSRLDFKDFVVPVTSIPTPIWPAFGLEIAYISIILTAACMIYNRRDIY